MPLDLDAINRALAAALSLISLGGQFAILGAEVYAHLKQQAGMSDAQIREHRDITLDANELQLLANLAEQGE